MPMTALPTPPSRQDPANFAARGDALLSALPAFVTEANALQAAVNEKEASTLTKAGEAAASAAAALISKNASATSEANSLAHKNAAAASEANSLAHKNAAADSAGAAAGSAASALAIYGTAAAMQTKLDTAAAQANAAAASAASAGSVLQQDLSMVSGAPLHRSPNAIVAQCIYDTSLDSDGGAWVDRMSHTSWMNEPLNGAWLGQLASEAAARALPGVATGDYYQLTTDGKFYALKAGTGTTEVFRGNKAKFPRLAAIVAEADRVIIYDLTEAGRPMWMRFQRRGSGAVWNDAASLQALAMLGGSLVFGSSGGMWEIKFPADSAQRSWTTGTPSTGTYSGTVASRNSIGSYDGVTKRPLVNGAVNAVAMTVLPDAPIDPATGLQIPTIAVGAAGGVSVIKADGTVANITGFVNSPAFIYFTKDNKIVSSSDYNDALWVYPIPTSNTTVSSYQEGFAFTQKGVAAGLVKTTNALAVADVYYTSKGIAKWKRNPANPTKALAAAITDKYNTGHMVGDTRRAYLANTEVESVVATELVTNGAFDAGTAGWAAIGSGGTAAIVGGELEITASSGTIPGMRQVIPTVIGKAYTLTVTARLGTNTAATAALGVSTVGFLTTSNATKTLTFVATGNTTNVDLTAGANGTVYFDNVSVKEAVPDRSYKAAAANIFGTLTKSAVAAAAQLVAYSGFSAANYLQEPYSADLDFGTGEWSVGAWVSYSAAAMSAIAHRSAATGSSITLGTDAAGKLTATAYDGTTTRTVTTANAYNTGTWLKARATYVAGKLAITVNGVEVASTVGAPLLTLDNSNAVLTIGNSRTLDAPFPGSIALLKLGATVPAPEQARWMYEQEKQMFRDGAQITLPAATAVTDMAYDQSRDRWVAVQAGNESSFTGLVRTATATPSAGSFAKVAATSGVKLLARTTTSPGVDVTIPAYGLREELVKRGETAAKAAKTLAAFDFDAVSFTATTTNASNQLTAVASVVGTPYIGMGISGTGIPAGTTLIGINGTTYTLSANATAAGTAVAMGQTDFTLPVGYTAKDVLNAGARKREGTTKDWVRLFDGFRETVRFAVSPGSAAWVQINAAKE